MRRAGAAADDAMSMDSDEEAGMSLLGAEHASLITLPASGSERRGGGGAPTGASTSSSCCRYKQLVPTCMALVGVGVIVALAHSGGGGPGHCGFGADVAHAYAQDRPDAPAHAGTSFVNSHAGRVREKRDAFAALQRVRDACAWDEYVPPASECAAWMRKMRARLASTQPWSFGRCFLLFCVLCFCANARP